MLIKEACHVCGLTRKAVEYYIAQGLLAPAVRENSYREFDSADVERLKKIAILRALDVPTAQIREILGGGYEAIARAAHAAGLAEADARQKQALLERLSQGVPYEEIAPEIAALARSQTIAGKLLLAFPGYFGRAISLHFAPFLREPLITDEQKQAYAQIVEYLDSVTLTLTADLQDYLEEATRGMGTPEIMDVSSHMQAALGDMEAYIANNREQMETYMAFRQSEEYKISLAYKLQQALSAFQNASGYTDKFLPAMQRLSKSYREYTTMLQNANKALLIKYPEIAQWQ